MNNKTDIVNTNHNISLNERSNLLISGVKRIENFDTEEFVMETTMGDLTIKGMNLELIKLDTVQGNISIKGNIDSLEYKEISKNKTKDTIFNRLFK